MEGAYWISDEAWAAIEPHLPKNRPGPKREDDRPVISGILHVLRSGCRWSDFPPVHGPRTTIFNRFNRWSIQGLWRRLFEQLAASGGIPDPLCLRDFGVAPAARNSPRQPRFQWSRRHAPGVDPVKERKTRLK
jgi:transposase